MGLAMCIIVPMSFINNLSAFVKICAIANVLTVMVLLSISLFAIGDMTADTPGFEYGRNNMANLDNISTVIGVAIYAFEAVGVMLTIKNSMKDSHKFARLL